MSLIVVSRVRSSSTNRKSPPMTSATRVPQRRGNLATEKNSRANICGVSETHRFLTTQLNEKLSYRRETRATLCVSVEVSAYCCTNNPVRSRVSLSSTFSQRWVQDVKARARPRRDVCRSRDVTDTLKWACTLKLILLAIANEHVRTMMSFHQPKISVSK